jgi:adenosylhomocysteine nucleosidase
LNGGSRLLGVVAALESEARTLGPAVQRRRDGLSSLGEGALLAVSGMGAQLAAIAARRLVDAGASRLLSFGFAGGLDPALSAGTVVLPTSIISSSGARFATSTDWRERLAGYIARQRLPVGGLLFSSSAPLDTVADKAAAFRATGAVAVDMESLAVAEVAAAHKLPFVAVRVILDTAADALPRAVTAASRAGQVSMPRLLGRLALAPLELVALFHLVQRYRAAIRSLAGVARAGLLTPDSGVLLA